MSHVNLYKKECIMKNPCVTSRWLPLAAVLALAGCGGGSDNEPGLTSDNTGLPEGMVEKTLPAASDEVYVNLETGELVDPSDTWHLKASRLTFRTTATRMRTSSPTPAPVPSWNTCWARSRPRRHGRPTAFSPRSGAGKPGPATTTARGRSAP